MRFSESEQSYEDDILAKIALEDFLKIAFFYIL